MSKINGDKARTAAANRKRNNQRAKDRARLAAIRANAGKTKSPAKPGA